MSLARAPNLVQRHRGQLGAKAQSVDDFREKKGKIED
jgi:hypothetical protein